MIFTIASLLFLLSQFYRASIAVITPQLTADTGIDSLCHSMEAYVSRKANSFTDSIALASMSAIAKNIA